MAQLSLGVHVHLWVVCQDSNLFKTFPSSTVIYIQIQVFVADMYLAENLHDTFSLITITRDAVYCEF